MTFGDSCLNALQEIIFKAGQKLHEAIFEAQLTIPGFQVTVPVTHSAIVTDFDLMPGGFSPKLMIETMSFRRELLNGDVPVKGIKCSLDMGNGAPLVPLQFWSGGLLTDGFTYKFMMVDANYNS